MDKLSQRRRTVLRARSACRVGSAETLKLHPALADPAALEKLAGRHLYVLQDGEGGKDFRTLRDLRGPFCMMAAFSSLYIYIIYLFLCCTFFLLLFIVGFFYFFLFIFIYYYYYYYYYYLLFVGILLLFYFFIYLFFFFFFFFFFQMGTAADQLERTPDSARRLGNEGCPAARTKIGRAENSPSSDGSWKISASSRI